MSSYFLFIFSSFYLLDIGHKNGYFGNGPKYNLGVTILTLRRWCISMTDSIVTCSWNTTLYAPMQYYKIVWHFRVRLSCKYWRNITKRRCQQVEIFNHTLVCYPSRKGNIIESITKFWRNVSSVPYWQSQICPHVIVFIFLWTRDYFLWRFWDVQLPRTLMVLMM